MGDSVGDYYRAYNGDTRSVDYGTVSSSGRHRTLPGIRYETFYWIIHRKISKWG